MNLTPTQERMMSVLADGRIHGREELLACFTEDQPAHKGDLLGIHVYNLRRKLRPAGQDVVWEKINGCAGYRHVRLVQND